MEESDKSSARPNPPKVKKMNIRKAGKKVTIKKKQTSKKKVNEEEKLSIKQKENLISEVFKWPCIWKKDTDEYHNKDQLSAAWESISTELAISGN